MMFFDVDVALGEVPVNSVPLLDDTDFKSVEEAVAYNAAGLELIWHFVTSAGAYTATVVTPTTAGDYDWAHQDGGMYTIEIPASGGASINNNAEGYGWFTGKATGVLPWRGPTIGFRAAAVNDALTDGGDLLDVNVTQYGGTNGTFSGGRPEVNATHWGGTAVGSATVNANMTQISGDSTAADNLEAAADGTGYNLGGGAVVAASVTGSVGSISGVTFPTNFASLAIDASGQVTVGAFLSSLDLTATMKASVNTQADTALSDYDAPTKAEMDSAFTEIKGATWATTDTLEAIRDRGDAAWVTATGFSTLTTGDIPTAASIRQEIDANSTQLATIVADLPARITKNTALNNFEFYMVDSDDHITAKTGLTITAQRSIDGGSFASCDNSASEVGNGIYKINLSADDLNGNVVTLRFTATGADTRLLTIVTQP